MEWCGVSLDEELSLCVLRGLGARALGRFAQASSDALGAWGKRTSASSPRGIWARDRSIMVQTVWEPRWHCPCPAVQRAWSQHWQ